MAGHASRLLAQLDAAIKKAPHPVEAQCLRAERAGLLARQGQLERARAAIDELQAELAWHPANAALRGWLALADGLHAYYSVIDRDALPLVEQAFQAARQASGARRLHATVAAWLATMAYTSDDMPRVAALIREALDTAAPEHHGARARAALVAGYVYHFAGHADVAARWYEASRRHATAEGDETLLSSLMHNQAGMRVNQARMALAFEDPATSGNVLQALMGVESIGHYDAGIGTASLGSLVPMLRAQVLTAQGRWSEAVALFDRHFDTAMTEGLRRFAPCLLADRAWCESHLGRADRARELALQSEQALQGKCDLDDRALASARLAQVRTALGDAAAAAAHGAEAQRLYAAHRDEQARIAAWLDEALAGIDPAQV